MIGFATIRVRFLSAVVGALGLFCGAGAQAQSLEQPPVLSTVDGNGVNLATGELSLPDMSVGLPGISRQGQAFLTRSTRTVRTSDNFTGTYVVVLDATPQGGGGMGGAYAGPYWAYVSYGGKVHRFLLGSGQITGTDGNGNPIELPSYGTGPFDEIGVPSPAKLDCGSYTTAQVRAHTATCTLKVSDGTWVEYVGSAASKKGLMSRITRTDGEVVDLTYHYDGSGIARSVNTVNSTLGWGLKYGVDGNYVVTSVSAVSTAVNACVPATCVVPGNAPVATLTISGNTRTIARNGSNLVSYTISGDTVTITPNGGAAKTVTLYPTTNTADSGKVQSVTIGGSTWGYTYTAAAPGLITTVTAPNATTRQQATDGKHKVMYAVDEAGRKTSYEYDSSYERLEKIINPDGALNTGGFTVYEYGARGNIAKTYVLPKSSISSYGQYATSTAAIVTSATYAASCDLPTATNSNYKYCNKPLTVTDPNGIVTTYSYHQPSGQVARVQGPVVSGTQSDMRYSYQQQSANAKYQGPGVSNPVLTTQAGVWRPTGTSSCMSSNWNGSACAAGAADERKITLSYTGSSNRLPTITTLLRGDNTLSQVSTVTYDSIGQVTVADGPKSGAVDEVYTFYDALGRVVGSVGVDPDGGTAGPRKRGASRTTYDTAGRVSLTQSGVVASGDYTGSTATDRYTQAFADFQNNFTAQVSDRVEYDSSTGLQTAKRTYIGTVADSTTVRYLTLWSYDNMFRVQCEAVRITVVGTQNPACQRGPAGSDGTNDRITKYEYNVLGAMVKTLSITGDPLNPRVEVERGFNISGATSSGVLEWIKDGKGNQTSYTYDTFNRLIKTCYPNKTTSGSSTSDCEQTSYRNKLLTNASITAAGTLTDTVTVRGGDVFVLGYDIAGRTISKGQIVSGSTIPLETYTYDNFGQLLTHSNSTPGHALVFANNTTTPAQQTNTYNALGWQLTSTVNVLGANGTSSINRVVAYQYDGIGRRSQMTYPDNSYITYGYSEADEMLRICDNAVSCTSGDSGTSLIDFEYDNDYGRRVSKKARKDDGTRVNLGTYAYDSKLRLQTVATHTNTVTLTYSTADQIATRANSNPIFDLVSPTANVATTYGANGLNQITQGTSFGYDTRGNLSSDGSVTYTYNQYNRLTDSSLNTFKARYDTQGRLQQVQSANTATTQFIYDGADLIAEYNNNGTLLRRYVHGSGVDEPLVWYEPSSSGAPKRFFVADERGSIISVLNSNGGVSLAHYQYDEYGVPSTYSGTAVSRFRYTGQVWLADAGLYYYKARMYAPSIGRFLQPDPIGYGDGMNMYAYVGNDPMNKIDPTGMACNPMPCANPPNDWNKLTLTDQNARNYMSDMGNYQDRFSIDCALKGGCFDIQIDIPLAASLDDLPLDQGAPTCPVDVPPGSIGRGAAQDFGPRKPPTEGASSDHNGQDFPNPIGAPVRAPMDGVVTKVYPHPRGGDSIIIDSGSYVFGFGHTEALFGIIPGVAVSRGEQIGRTNKSGKSTGPHLHFTVTLNGAKIDPMKVVKTACSLRSAPLS